MNKMMYTKININKVLYKTLTTINFNLKNMRFLFKSDRNRKKDQTTIPDSLCHP